MSVFNQERYLPTAIESILNQSYTDFEFIIVNDGSTDSSNNIIHSYKDKRIVLIQQENSGLPAALNLAISQAKGDFIARMDSDDIAHPSRIEKQFEYLNQNPGVDLIGSSVRLIGEEGEPFGVDDVPIRPEEINKSLTYRCIVYHPTFFFKKEVFKKVGGYRKEFINAQDYDFLLRARSKNITMANQADYLLDYRIYTKPYFDKGFNRSRFDRGFNRSKFSRLAQELDKERIKFGSENSRTFSQVKRIEDKGDYQRLVYRPFLKLNSLANRLTGFKKNVIRILSVLIGLFTKEARSEIFNDFMYYRVQRRYFKQSDPSSSIKKKLLVFLQEGYYLTKLNVVLEKFPNHEVTVISRSPIICSRNIDTNFSTRSTFRVITTILKLRNTTFDVLLVSNVDDFFFHLIYKFSKFNEFVTFDEGQRSLISDDFYFEKNFTASGQARIKLLNRFFKFPLPYGRYFDESSIHYTFYDEKLFNHALKDHKNLILLEGNKGSKLKKQIKKVFLGTSSDWYTDYRGTSIEKGSHLYNEKIPEAAKRINNLNPDLYLMHPREGSELVVLLNDDIIINKNPYGGNEFLMNALNVSNEIEVYAERTGIVFDLDPAIDVIFVNIFDRFDNNDFQGFIDKFDNFRKQQNPKYNGSKKVFYKKNMKAEVKKA